MARVKLADGREFDIPDGDSALETYYRGEGATVTTASSDGPPSLPAVFDGEQYVAAATDLGEHVFEGTGEANVGYSVPANSDGTFGPATLGPDGATAEVDGETVELQPDSTSGDVPAEQDIAGAADQSTDLPAKSTRSKS